MLNLSLCFTGFRKKDEVVSLCATVEPMTCLLSAHVHRRPGLVLLHVSKSTVLLQVNLVNLVHHMGGTIRKDFSAKVTHLVAHSTHGEKYRVSTAVIPVCVCLCVRACVCVCDLHSRVCNHIVAWALRSIAYNTTAK